MYLISHLAPATACCHCPGSSKVKPSGKEGPAYRRCVQVLAKCCTHDETVSLCDVYVCNLVRTSAYFWDWGAQMPGQPGQAQVHWTCLRMAKPAMALLVCLLLTALMLSIFLHGTSVPCRTVPSSMPDA